MVTESIPRQASTLHPSRSKGSFVRAVLGGVLLVLLLAIALGRAAWAQDPQGTFIYTISRDGTPIGQQRLEFVNDGEKLRVLSHTELDVTLLGLTLYDFKQQVEEVHFGGKIISLISDADDDGTERRVSLALQGNLLTGEYNGNDRALNPQLTTSLFWQKPSMGDTQVIDTLRGRKRDVSVKDLGTETIALPVGRVEAQHYRLTGDWKRDLWYDANGVLVAGELVKDGATVRQELQQRP
jgi:hypothetical protein